MSNDNLFRTHLTFPERIHDNLASRIGQSGGGGNIDIVVDTTTCPDTTIGIIPDPTIVDPNVAMVIAPKGTGFFATDIPDMAVPGGNCRGENAVDMQMVRNQAQQVASGDWSTIGGGRANTASGDGSAIGGGGWSGAIGAGNIASGISSFIGAGVSNRTQGDFAVVGGGEDNQSQAEGTFIGGGSNHIAQALYSTVCGGQDNQAQSVHSFVGGGTANRAVAQLSTICGGGGAGLGNDTSGDFSFIGGGQDNMTTAGVGGGRWGTIGGGSGNQVIGNYGALCGGENNIAGIRSFVGGGSGNSAGSGSSSSVVVGGGNNIAYGPFPSLVGGLNQQVGGGFDFSGPAPTTNPNYGNESFIGGGQENFSLGLGVDTGGNPVQAGSGGWTTVGGGYRNYAINAGASILGGGVCVATGVGSTDAFNIGASAIPYFVFPNTAGNVASGVLSTICGGGIGGNQLVIGTVPTAHQATGDWSFIGGGGGTTGAHRNVASGIASSVIGGRGNTAAGDFSVACGLSANDGGFDNCFVWRSNGTTIGATAANQFVIETTGNVSLRGPYPTAGAIATSTTDSTDSITILVNGVLRNIPVY
jgi:hypothetical protein